MRSVARITRTMIAAAVVVCSAGIGTSASPAAIASGGITVTLVPHGSGEVDSIDQIADDGSRALAGLLTDQSVEWVQIALPAGEVSPITIEPCALPSDGAYSWGFVQDEQTVVRYDNATGAARQIPLQFPADDGNWFPIDVLGSSDGTVVAVQASNPNLGRVESFLFDAAGTPITDGERGLSTSTDQSGLIGISPDGTYVSTYEFDRAGAPAHSRVIRWNRATDERRIVDINAPDLTYAQVVSDDLEWALFSDDESWYRVSLANGTVERLRSEVTSWIDDVAIARGGRLVVNSADDDWHELTQLYVWDVGSEPVLVSADGDGHPADAAVDDWALSADGSRVVFTSSATNLAEGTSEPARRLYLAELPDLGLAPLYPPADHTVAPSNEACGRVADGLPGDIAVVNVTPVNATGPGHGTLRPGTAAAGDTSNVNFRAGSVDPNIAFVPIGDDGRVCFVNSEHSGVDVIVDQLGFTRTTSVRPADAAGAARIVDTRVGLGGATLAPSRSLCVAPAADPGEYVIVNVTPVNAGGPGFGVVHSSDDAAGATSNVNFDAGSVDPNVAIVEVGADGTICFTNSEHATVDVVIDHLATAEADAFRPASPSGAARLLDTRAGTGATTLAPSASACVAPGGVSPGDWMVVNVTPVNATGPGHGTLHRGDRPAGATSNVNFRAGSVDPNVAVVEVGADGTICFTNSEHAAVDVVLDHLVTAAPDTFGILRLGTARLFDTRG